MNGFEWPDRRDEEGVIFIRSLRHLTNRLPSIHSQLQGAIQHELRDFVDETKMKNGMGACV